MGEVYLFLAEGFEEIEALTTVDLCRRAGISISTVAIGAQRTVVGSHHIPVEADRLFEETDFSDLDMLVLPGGGKGTDNLEAHGPLMDLLQKKAAEGKWISAICAAPRILGRHGLLQGRQAVCYPGFEDRLTGATVGKQKVVRDGRILTAVGMGVAMDFGLELIRMLVDDATAARVKSSVLAD